MNIEKYYPYFLSRDPNSNFMRLTSIYDSEFIDLLNAIFSVKEGYHIDKRCWIYREQSIHYNYKIHFHANYRNIKKVYLYKNKELIKSFGYSKEEIGKYKEVGINEIKEGKLAIVTMAGRPRNKTSDIVDQKEHIY